jgi:cytochrome d ubiquinol oxidase subunit I
VALGSSLSALWILIANGWMQNPVGSAFNYETMRMEVTNFAEVIFNPVAQVKFVHTVSAGYVTGAVFVLAISSYYLLKKQDVAFAKRSFAIASAFGLASIISVIILGDESGYEVGDVQKMKLATIEAEWKTHPAPAAFTVVGFPNQETEETTSAVKIPYLLGLIATRSISEPVHGIRDLREHARTRIVNGMQAYALLTQLKGGNDTPENRAAFEKVKSDLGYGLLLKRYTDKVVDATPAQIDQAARDTVPKVAPMFWSFRVMVACGFAMLFIFIYAFWLSTKHQQEKPRWFLKLALFSLPLPWVACETGWFVAEYGRQPWAIAEILPTRMAASNLTTDQVWTSLVGIILFYTVLLVIEMYLMVRFSKQGPSSLHTGRYDLENTAKTEVA